MRKVSFALLVSLLAVAAAAQDKKVTVDDFAGTWNIEVMSHQVALVIEKQDATKVTATLMIMGRDMPLKGDLVDRTITLVGVKTEGDAPQPQGGNPHANAVAKPIVITLTTSSPPASAAGCRSPRTARPAG